MRCENCFGTGYYWWHTQEGSFPTIAPCPECGGLRILSCCEGSYRHGQLMQLNPKQGKNQTENNNDGEKRNQEV